MSDTKQELIIPEEIKRDLTPTQIKEISPIVNAVNKALQQKWWWEISELIATNLLDILHRAVAPDNKWNLHEDFKSKIRVLELLMKATDKNFDKSDINFNFFQAPNKIDY